jgi:hypothetical protein
MERKEFLKASLCLGALCGAPALGGDEKPSACERNMEFARRWVKDFMDHVDGQLAEPQRVQLMQARGRSCARGGPARVAEAHKGDVDAFVAEMAKQMGPDGMRREGSVVKVRYPQCYCPLVSELKEPLSATYCECSIGWLKELFETASGKPVRVAALETVKRGGSACRFEVTLGG